MIEELRRPKRLRAGDRLAAVSLSWGGPGAFPDRYQAGVRQLEEAFDVTVAPTENALREEAWIAANPKARADDLLSAFEDPAIDGIVATIGGDDSIRTLPFLDLEAIARNPKVFLGFSDTTTTHLACLRAGLGTFYGPSIMAGFGENTGIFPYTADGVRRMLFEPEDELRWPENHDGWTVEHLDWSDPASQSRARALQPSTGCRWHGEVAVEGPMVVGCLEVLDWLRGTAWWPDLDGAVLAIETSEEGSPPTTVARFLRSLAAMGDLQRIVGLLLGRPGGASVPADRHQAYDEAALGILRDECGLSVPLVAGMDFGHTDPAWTIPMGVPVRIDPAQRAVVFRRAGVV